jgi:hypothetical protein
MQSCFQGALDFFLLSFGFKVGKFQVGAEVFFFKCMWCGEWTIQSGHWTFHASFIRDGQGGGRKGFIFLSANKRAQVKGDKEDIFFQFSLFPNMFPQCSF